MFKGRLLKQIRNKRPALLLMAVALTISTLAPLFRDGTPASAAASANYTWSTTDGSIINVSGGDIKPGQQIHVATAGTNITGTGAKAKINATATYTTGILFWQQTQTADCYVPIIVSFTSETAGKATLDTNYTEVGGTTVQCNAYSSDTVTPMFNNTTFTISGNRVGAANSPETDEQKKVTFVIATGTKTAADVPSSLVINVTGAATASYTVQRDSYDATVSGVKGTYYRFQTTQLLNPGAYTACPTAIQSYISCANFTKVKFASLTVPMGTQVVGDEDPNTQQIRAHLEIDNAPSNWCSATVYGPYAIDLKDASGNTVSTTNTDSNTVPVSNLCGSGASNGGMGPQNFTAVIKSVAPGTYQVCAGSVCKSVTKERDQVAQVFLVGDYNKIAAVSQVANSSSCVIDGIGWLICGFTSFIADVADNVYSLIENILKVPVINTDTGSGTNGVYNAWTIMRNLANVVFVIMFLIIIFAQLTGQGVSNYGVKKTLPRLIVAAVLVNVSFWLSAVVVDLSNIIGAGLYNLLRGVVNSMNVGISTNWGNILGALMGGTGFAVGTLGVGVGAVAAAASIPGIGGALLFLAIPLVLGAMLAILAVAVILIARQALVVILIIVSPLAFVALLLPNTESLFKRWRTTLTSLLLMYPIVSIIFGGAQIAGFAILSTAARTTDPLTTWIAIITGQFVIVAPFFFLPTILIKFSGGNLDKLAATIQNRGQKLIGGITGAARSEGNARLARGFNRAKYGTDSGAGGIRNNLRRTIGRYGRSFDQRKDGDKLADSYLGEQHSKATNERLGTDAAYATRIAGGDVAEGQRIASRAIASAEAEELKRALEPLRRTLAGMDGGQQKTYLQSEIAKGGTNALAALHYAAQSSRTDILRDGVKNANTDIQRMANEAIQANVASVMGKAPALVKGPAGAFESVKAADMATWDADTAQEFADHLASITDPKKLADATDAFNVAINNLADTPALKSTFSTETAKKLQSAIVAKPTLSSTLITKRIGSDGSLT